MDNTLKQIIRMRASLWVNSFLYYFQRLWLIGKLIPDSLFGNYRLKRGLSVAAVLLRQLLDLLGKPLYLLCFAGLPIALLTGRHPELKGQSFALLVHILFFLNCLLGPLGDSQIFTVTRDKVTFLKYLQLAPRRYCLCSFAYRYLPFFLFYLPFLLAAARFTGGTLLQGFLLWLMLAAFRMMGEALQLFWFHRTEKVLSRSMVCNWILLIVCPAAAYLLPALGLLWPADAVLLHPAAVVLWLGLGLACGYYILFGYRYYDKKLPRSLDLNFLLSSLLKNSSTASFKEVEIKEKDLKLPAAGKERIRHLKGYAYFNALFFARHRRQLVRPVYYRLLMATAIFLFSLVLFFTRRETAVNLSRNLTALLPSFVFLMYFMTVADKACRAMFYNCDKDMLHYAFYRQPKTILKNFQIRLLRISLYDLAIGGALCVFAAIFCLLCGTSVLTWDFLLFCAAILLLSILFTAHHLCLYYIFQPYSESLRIKNPFFSVINTVMYFLCFLCLEIKAERFVFTAAVLGFTLFYIAAVLLLVYRRAPKAFRIK